MQMAFDVQIQNVDGTYEIENKPDSYTIFFHINQSQERFVKTRYSGLNTKKESFEETQKRTEDLRELVVESNIATSAGSASDKPNAYIATLPADYFVAVDEEATIEFIDGLSNPVSKRVGVTESTSDTYRKQIDDPYSPHKLHYEDARPLRLYKGTSIEVISDGNYTVPTVHLRYLSMPTEISLAVDCALPEHTHSEIVNMAVSDFLNTVKQSRKKDERPEVMVEE